MLVVCWMLDRGGVDAAAASSALMKPFLTIVWSTTPERGARGLDVGGRRIIGRRLDQAGDDRRLAEAQMVGAMAEEAARRGVDAIGAAAEIDAVEIELEDLVLAELALQRERQDRLLDLAAEAAVVGQEDVARELLGDRRGRADAVAVLTTADAIARPIPIGSTPMWLRKRRSSVEIIAARISGGIWS